MEHFICLPRNRKSVSEHQYTLAFIINGSADIRDIASYVPPRLMEVGLAICHKIFKINTLVYLRETFTLQVKVFITWTPSNHLNKISNTLTTGI